MALICFGEYRIEAEADCDVLNLLIRNRVPIDYLCMSGTCRTCRIEVVSGGEHLEPITELELSHFPDSTGEIRLACQTIMRATGDVFIKQGPARSI